MEARTRTTFCFLQQSPKSGDRVHFLRHATVARHWWSAIDHSVVNGRPSTSHWFNGCLTDAVHTGVRGLFREEVWMLIRIWYNEILIL